MKLSLIWSVESSSFLFLLKAYRNPVTAASIALLTQSREEIKVDQQPTTAYTCPRKPQYEQAQSHPILWLRDGDTNMKSSCITYLLRFCHHIPLRDQAGLVQPRNPAQGLSFLLQRPSLSTLDLSSSWHRVQCHPGSHQCPQGWWKQHPSLSALDVTSNPPQPPISMATSRSLAVPGATPS